MTGSVSRIGAAACARFVSLMLILALLLVPLSAGCADPIGAVWLVGIGVLVVVTGFYVWALSEVHWDLCSLDAAAAGGTDAPVSSLRVENLSPVEIEIDVDGVVLGAVPPEGIDFFPVTPGERAVGWSGRGVEYGSKAVLCPAGGGNGLLIADDPAEVPRELRSQL